MNNKDNMLVLYNVKSKSVVFGLVLCLLFGPLGLLYVDILAGMIWLLVSYGILSLGAYDLLLFVWIVSLLYVYVEVREYNNRLEDSILKKWDCDQNFVVDETVSGFILCVTFCVLVSLKWADVMEIVI